MKKLIMWNVITLDGYFQGVEPWDLSFHQLVWGEELEAYALTQLSTANALIFGRNTYTGMATHWQSPENVDDPVTSHMNAIKKFVCSETLESAEWNNTEILKNAVEDITRLKQEGEGNLFVFGSGMLSDSLIKAGLFDEYRLCIAPTILGNGRKLFESGLPQEKLSLLESKTLASGGVLLRYGVIR